MLEQDSQLLITIPLSVVKITSEQDSLTSISSHPVNLRQSSQQSFPSQTKPTSSIPTHTSPSHSGPHLAFSDSEAEDILLVIDQSPVQSVNSIYSSSTHTSLHQSIQHNSDIIAARKFPSPPDAHTRKPIRRHIRYKDQRRFPAANQFFNFLCFSRERRVEYPKARKFLFSNVPY